MSHAEYLAFALRLGELAGEAILPHYRREIDVDNKAVPGGYFDPVTAADRGAEAVIRREIQRVYPTHGVYGEEQGRTAGDSNFLWVIDPIDGTRAFILGQLHWGTLIALNDGAKPVVGVMHQPYVNETFLATSAGAFWKRGSEQRPLRTRACPEMKDAAICTTFIKTAHERAIFEEIASHARMTRYGGDCYNYCLLAAGFIDVVIETGLSAYDVQAIVPMIEAAGGAISTWSGGSPNDGGSIVTAGDPRLHETLLTMLSSSANRANS